MASPTVPSGIVSPAALLEAYSQGWFPMEDEEGRIGLYEADPRAVMPIERFRVPRSVERAARRGGFEVRVDGAFEEVVRACARRAEGTWLGPGLATAYLALHRLGYAHSVECWREGRLVGGLFGVALGGLFTSESMFHRAPDAGNLTLVATARRLAERRYLLWDIQTVSAHTRRFGAVGIPPRVYRRRLRAAIRCERTFA